MVSTATVHHSYRYYLYREALARGETKNSAEEGELSLESLDPIVNAWPLGSMLDSKLDSNLNPKLDSNLGLHSPRTESCALKQRMTLL